MYLTLLQHVPVRILVLVLSHLIELLMNEVLMLNPNMVNRLEPSFYPWMAFQTLVDGRPRTCGVIVDLREDDRAINFNKLQSLATVAMHNQLASAGGKVAVIRSESISVMQTSVSEKVTPVWCGNATAAAAFYTGNLGESRFVVHGPSRKCYHADIRIKENKVEQNWVVTLDKVVECIWRDRRVVFASFLNEYAIVEGPLPNDITPEDARCELVGNCLHAKLAVVSLVGGYPIVEFFNSNGKHGAAPQTGLATIAVAMRSTRWLKSLFRDHLVSYRTTSGIYIENIPVTSAVTNRSICVKMPAVTVEIVAQAESVSS